MKERMLFVCIGQGGGNIGQLFENKGYNCLFINTAYDDLKTLDGKHKLHITGTFGCNRDRKKALKYLKEGYNAIVNAIESRFPQQDLIYLVFTAGGGTGSGLSPALLQLLARENSDKTYGAITVLPGMSESIKAQMNAIETFKDLSRVDNLRNLIVLDNNNLNDKMVSKLDLNERFVSIFNLLMNISIPDERGVIDFSELETLITCKGSMYLSVTPRGHCIGSQNGHQNIDSEKITSLSEDIINISDTNVFTPFETGTCEYLAISQGGQVDESKMKVEIDELKKLVGTPIDTFIGYNDSVNFTIMAGMPHPTQRIRQIVENIEREHKKKMKENEQNVNSKNNNYIEDLELPVFDFNMEGNRNGQVSNKNEVSTPFHSFKRVLCDIDIDNNERGNKNKLDSELGDKLDRQLDKIDAFNEFVNDESDNVSKNSKDKIDIDSIFKQFS